jgi:hypothetical protein
MIQMSLYLLAMSNRFVSSLLLSLKSVVVAPPLLCSQLLLIMRKMQVLNCVREP